MHEYDTVLKALLQSSQNSIFEKIIGVKFGRWLNVELSEVLQTRVDLLFETLDLVRRLISVELQSTNDPRIALRMAEYSLRVYRIYERFPEQYVLYVGNAEMSMPCELKSANHTCRYTLIDIREVAEETLLDSPFAADNILAILTRHRDRRETIRRILERIAKLEDGARHASFSKLMILAGLRKLGDTIRTEVKQMPILDDINGPRCNWSRHSPRATAGQARRPARRQTGRRVGHSAPSHPKALRHASRLGRRTLDKVADHRDRRPFPSLARRQECQRIVRSLGRAGRGLAAAKG